MLLLQHGRPLRPGGLRLGDAGRVRRLGGHGRGARDTNTRARSCWPSSGGSSTTTSRSPTATRAAWASCGRTLASERAGRRPVRARPAGQGGRPRAAEGSLIRLRGPSRPGRAAGRAAPPGAARRGPRPGPSGGARGADPVPAVRAIALRAACGLGGTEAWRAGGVGARRPQRGGPARRARGPLARRPGRAATRRLAALAASPIPSERAWAARVVGEAASSRVPPRSSATLLSDPSPAVRRAALAAAGRARERTLWPAVADGLGDRRLRERRGGGPQPGRRRRGRRPRSLPGRWRRRAVGA